MYLPYQLGFVRLCTDLSFSALTDLFSFTLRLAAFCSVWWKECNFFSVAFVVHKLASKSKKLSFPKKVVQEPRTFNYQKSIKVYSKLSNFVISIWGYQWRRTWFEFYWMNAGYRVQIVKNQLCRLTGPEFYQINVLEGNAQTPNASFPIPIVRGANTANGWPILGKFKEFSSEIIPM